MQRTQIYLDDEEADLLAAVSAQTGASRSELIRRAVRAQYASAGPAQRLSALQATAGAWTQAQRTGADEVDALRGPLVDRWASDSSA